MYISKLTIQNFRCFQDFTIEFNEGLNVLIGGNNAGKTTVIKALEFLFKRGSTRTPSVDDFYKSLDVSIPPEITITAKLTSSKTDTMDDKAIVASWLTKLETPWEAELTYKYFLPEQDQKKYIEESANLSTTRERWSLLERSLKRYVARIYGGNFINKNRAEPEYLDKIHCETLDALRDVENKMFTGKNTLLKQLLIHFKDKAPLVENHAKITDDHIVTTHSDNFSDLARSLVDNIVRRVNHREFLEFAEKTGASVGGIPALEGNLQEGDVLSALRLIIKDQTGIEIPIINNGMGYNNLIYISLILSKFKMITSAEYGENAKSFPILLIEEPEAHLHPALQYNFLKFLKDELDNQSFSRQIFITTHSTQITSAVGLKPVICLEKEDGKGVHAKYPNKVFSESKEDQDSRKYVERFLDATKSAMLFAKSVVLVEGMAELILLPILAQKVHCDMDKHHVALVRVDALTFKHFIKLYGASIKTDRKQYAMEKRVSCIVDSDPAKIIKKKEKGKRRSWKGCWPFELYCNPDTFNYMPLSGALRNLIRQVDTCSNVEIFYKQEKGKTFEYDLAWDNLINELLFSPEVAITEVDELKASDWTEEEKKCAKFASSFLLHAHKQKGELAFELASRIQENKSTVVNLPKHIQEAFEWACYRN
ncbi:SMC domain-containing protein [Paenibacillus algicola]|uniref:SMC domain-containing protein n=1 Tax=Paenibacillus algicola TaxID=2565926 RepID=A0A4P8XGM2_9BACL|nr:AAA family ATPase [Paenibacillus algicola]QCT01465.1 SMC domain-containing protein [Paenibacillus algicola]